MTPTETSELMQAVADVVNDQVALALRDLVTELAIAKSQIAELKTHEKSLSDLRDRVVMFEAKASVPLPVVAQVSAPDPVDLSPVLERLAAAEARLDVLGDLRDRVVTVETKAATPIPTDAAVYELRERVMAMETKAMPVVEVPAEVSARLTALEARPLVIPPDPVDLTPVLERVAKLELKSAEITPVLASVSDVTKDIGAIRERVAVLEVKPLLPGPPGKDGEPGKDGAPGLNGKDGLAGLSYEGVYQEGQTYERGQLATWAGSSWHCNETTTSKPGEGSKAWTLMVKRGRDGRDGKDAEVVPVVKVS